jgi:hypothetical protein
MKVILMLLSLLISMCFVSSLVAADKVVVVPLGKSAAYTNQTFYYNLPVSAFVPVLTTDTAPRVNFIGGEWLMLHGTATIVGLAAPVQLPDGAELSDFTCYAYDNEGTQDISSNSPVYLWRRAVLSADNEQITTNFGMETTGESTAVKSFSAPSITFPTIDNSAYFYGAYVLYKLTGDPATDNQLRFYGCRITYTLDVLTP